MTTAASESWWPRALLAGPWSLLAALITMAAMATWIPEGTARVDNLLLPLLLFPLIWAVFFFAACLDANLKRATLISFGVTALNLALLARHLL